MESLLAGYSLYRYTYTETPSIVKARVPSRELYKPTKYVVIWTLTSGKHSHEIVLSIE